MIQPSNSMSKGGHQAQMPAPADPPSYYQAAAPQTQMPMPMQTLQSPYGTPKQEPPKTAAQIGEEYRATLFADCAQGKHQLTTTYGVCGIITGVLLFPIGLICLCIDKEKKCDRCGVRID